MGPRLNPPRPPPSPSAKPFQSFFHSSGISRLPNGRFIFFSMSSAATSGRITSTSSGLNSSSSISVARMALVIMNWTLDPAILPLFAVVPPFGRVR